jgi:hypothetical protein
MAKSEFQWYRANFEALYLPNYEDFALVVGGLRLPKVLKNMI